MTTREYKILMDLVRKLRRKAKLLEDKSYRLGAKKNPDQQTIDLGYGVSSGMRLASAHLAHTLLLMTKANKPK